MRTETLAIVFTDIKGYTAATSAQTHQENARMLRRIERVVAPVVGSFDGRVIKSIGDAYMIVFRSPTEAVRCAAAIQDRLHQHNASASADQAIHLRIAMNVGEVRVHRGDVYGDPVNIAARLENVTPADDIYLSAAVYLTMNRSDMPCERVGDFDLKGIPEPITVYRVRKFAHLEDGEAPKSNGGRRKTVQGLPYGGRQLSHWRRLKWLRRANMLLWAVVVAGLAGAGYLRYRPVSDYADLVSAAQQAAEAGNAMDVLAASGQIPIEAVEERQAVRRFRRTAVALLLAGKQHDTADDELQALLNEDSRDAEALKLRAQLAYDQGDLGEAMRYLSDSLKLQPSLGKRPEVITMAVEGYKDNATVKSADHLAQTVIKKDIIPELAKALNEGAFEDRKGRLAAATRLEKLGAAHQVDWVLLAVEDLKSTNCKVRKAAISRLLAENDDRAVGPLMKVADSEGCGAPQAKNAVNVILNK